MQAFDKWRRQFKSYKGQILNDNRDGWVTAPTEEMIWRAALEHFNKLFLDGTHPQDVIFAMQKELEKK